MSRRTIVLNKRNLKTISFGIALPIGSAFEPIPGISTVLFEHLERNTSKSTEDEFANKIDKYGITISSSVRRTDSQIAMTCPPKYFKTAFQIFQEMILEPAFDDKIISNIAQQQAGVLQQIQSQPESILTNYTKWNVTYDDDPVTKHPYGDLESLPEIKSDKLEDWHKKILTFEPQFASVGVDLTETMVSDAGVSDFKGQFGGETKSGSAITSPMRELYSQVDKPTMESTNAYIGVNLRGGIPNRAEEDFYRAVLSGGVSFPIYREIREKRNLSYAPRMSRDKFIGGSFFTALMDVRPERSIEALKTTLQIMHNAINNPIPEDELKRGIKVAQKVAVFISDSSSSYTNFILGRSIIDQTYNLDEIKNEIEIVANSDWQEEMRKLWVKKNLGFSASGEPGEVADKWLEIVEEVL